uniref:Uncharacterized protein n=1 Tax=Tetranychus urticae TaxID=32264 RepID=T1KFD8_TETUR
MYPVSGHSAEQRRARYKETWDFLNKSDLIEVTLKTADLLKRNQMLQKNIDLQMFVTLKVITFVSLVTKLEVKDSPKSFKGIANGDGRVGDALIVIKLDILHHVGLIVKLKKDEHVNSTKIG